MEERVEGKRKGQTGGREKEEKERREEREERGGKEKDKKDKNESMGKRGGGMNETMEGRVLLTQSVISSFKNM